MSYRRTNEPRPLEDERSTAGATSPGDHGREPGPTEKIIAALSDIDRLWLLYWLAAGIDIGKEGQTLSEALQALRMNRHNDLVGDTADGFEWSYHV